MTRNCFYGVSPVMFCLLKLLLFCLLNYLVKEIAGQFSGKIIDILKNNLFSIATDGSNENITENKMYPLVVTYFDGVSKKIRCNLLSLLVLAVDSTGENIAELINEEFSSHNIPWENCLILSCDNANVIFILSNFNCKIKHD